MPHRLRPISPISSAGWPIPPAPADSLNLRHAFAGFGLLSVLTKPGKQWSPLSEMYVNQRHLRFTDGPDEVHHMVVGRAKISRHQAFGR
jgi:hypothetical protein